MIPFQWLRPPSVREPQFAPTGCRLASVETSSGIIAKQIQIQRQRHTDKDKYTGCRLASSGIIFLSTSPSNCNYSILPSMSLSYHQCNDLTLNVTICSHQKPDHWHHTRVSWAESRVLRRCEDLDRKIQILSTFPGESIYQEHNPWNWSQQNANLLICTS